MNKYIEQKNEDFFKLIDFFKKEISAIRTGRANSSILEAVQVDAYGVKNAINAVASVNVLDGQTITISPWDKSVLKNIEKAIIDANLGLGVVNEGTMIRLTVARMTEDARKEMVKKLNKKQEEARISLRNVREEIKNNIEKAEKEKEIGEDDKFKFIKDLDAEITKMNDELKKIRDKKEEDIMTI